MGRLVYTFFDAFFGFINPLFGRRRIVEGLIKVFVGIINRICNQVGEFLKINTEILKSPTHHSLRSLRSKLRGIRRFSRRISGYYLLNRCRATGY